MKDIDKLLKAKTGISLDVGCGNNDIKGWVGMDLRPLKNVDIVHDIQVFPWPLPDSVCSRILMSHIYEHIEPKHRIRLIDECWRVIRPDGQLFLSSPYAMSMGAFQDPTHYPCPNEVTFTYFDPEKSPILYGVYKPKPWKLIKNAWRVDGNVEVILEPRKYNNIRHKKRKSKK
jgi:SAM-dependent methyltransferase